MKIDRSQGGNNTNKLRRVYNIVIFSITAYFLYQFSGFGITAGAHRLWAHRSYKAKWPLQLVLMIMNTVAFQVRDKFLLKSREKEI